MTQSPEELLRRVEQLRSQFRAVQAQSATVTRQAADTEEAVADTLAQLAAQHPRHAERLRAKSDEARRQAIVLRLREREEQIV